VFVADSQWDLMEENLESMKNLEENLAEYNVQPEDRPMILQYNKRDLDDIAPVWYLEYLLNATHGVPVYESSALDGTGVLDTLNHLCRFVIRRVVHQVETGTF